MDDLVDLDWAAPAKKTSSSPFDLLSKSSAGSGPNYYSSSNTPRPGSSTSSVSNLAAGNRNGTPSSVSNLVAGAVTNGRSTPRSPPAPAAASGGADAFSSLLGMSSGGAGKNLSMAEKQAQLAAQKKQKEEEDKQRWGDNAFWDSFGGGSTAATSVSVTPGIAPPAASAKPTAPTNILSPIPTNAKPSLGAALKASSSEGKPKSSAGSLWDNDLLRATNPAPSTKSPSPVRDQSDSGSFWDGDDLLGGPSKPQASKPSARGKEAFWDDDDLLGGGSGSGKQTASRNATAGPSDPWDVDALAQAVPSSSTNYDNGYASEDDDLLGELGKPVRQSASPKRQSTVRRESPPRAQGRSSPPPHIIGQIVEMGFAPDRARAALAATSTGEDVQAAMELLLASGQNTPAAPTPQTENDEEREDRLAAERRARHAARRRGVQRDAARPDSAQDRQAAADSLDPDRLMAQASEIGASVLSKATSFWNTSKERALKVYEEQRKVLEEQRAQGRKAPSQPAADGRPRWMIEAEGGELPAAADFGDDALGFKDTHSDDEGRPRPQQKARQEARQHKAPRALPDRTAAALFAEEQPRRYVSPHRHKVTGRASSSTTPARTPARAPSPLKERALVPATPQQTSTAAQHKTKGNEHFKLGRFAEADTAYSAAIKALPAGHIHLVPLYNNRAATRIKLGEPGTAAGDCTAVLELIGVGYHPAKEAPLPADVDVKLPEAYGKALVKRAQAWEMGEKWSKALEDWERVLGLDSAFGVTKSQASDGVKRAKAMLNGGGTDAGLAVPAAQGRTPSPAARPKPKPRPAPPAVVGDSAAVAELRKAAAAAVKEDEQRDALKDSVDARLETWKRGKETNIRALLASLDTVLWDGVLVKVGMHELVTEKQVKIKYMKVIARLHPDKLAASGVNVEQRMLANGVFGTLSEAWQAFQGGQ